MGVLTLHNVDDELARLLRDRARKRHHSIEQEALNILREAIGRESGVASTRLERARAIAALTPRAQRTDTVTLLHEERSL